MSIRCTSLADNIVEQMDAAGTPTARYTQGLGIDALRPKVRDFGRRDEPLEVQIGRGSYYYHADALGSIVAMTKSNGSVANSYTHVPFGSAYPASQTVANAFEFTGREWDSETSLYYYRARYYDPLFGRFLSEDPARLGSGDLNLYRYVHNSPTGWTDPSGLAEASGCVNRGTPGMTCTCYLDLRLPGTVTRAIFGCPYVCGCSDGSVRKYKFACSFFDVNALDRCPSTIEAFNGHPAGVFCAGIHLPQPPGHPRGPRPPQLPPPPPPLWPELVPTP